MNNHYDFSKFEPKAWINAIADEGSKQEMIWWLYETDAERNKLAIRVKELEKAQRAEGGAQDAARWRCARTIFAMEDIQIADDGMGLCPASEEENVKADAAIDAVIKRRSGMNNYQDSPTKEK